MFTSETFKRLEALREEMVFIFPRACLHAVVQKWGRATYMLARTLLSWGKVFVYSQAVESLNFFLAVYRLAGFSENLLLASPHFHEDALELVLTALHKEVSPAVLILEVEQVPKDFSQKFYPLLLKGHTAVFCTEKEDDPLLELCDEVYYYSFEGGYHVFEEFFGGKRLFLEKDHVLVEVCA